MNLPLNQIVQGHVLDILKDWSAESIDCIMFSPPYYGLRDYGKTTETIWDGRPDCDHQWTVEGFNQHAGRGDCQKGGKYSEQTAIPDKKLDRATCILCGAWKGQLGLEPTPQMYVEHLTQSCREMKRVLKGSGSLWINMGDTYFGGGGRNYGHSIDSRKEKKIHTTGFTIKMKIKGFEPKCLMGIPWKLAFSLIDDGWLLRNDNCWYKPNHMPQSAKDRLSNAWEHVFFFVKNRKYHFDLDAIRIPHKYLQDVQRRIQQDKKDGINPFAKRSTNKQWRRDQTKYDSKYEETDYGQPQQGFIRDQSIAKKRSYARIEAKKLFPDDTKSQQEYINFVHNHGGHFKGKNPSDHWQITTKPFRGAHFAVFPPDLCDIPIKATCPKNGVFLDPFCGSGTACLVARNNGCNFIGIDMNPDYVAIARKRLGLTTDLVVK